MAYRFTRLHNQPESPHNSLCVYSGGDTNVTKTQIGWIHEPSITVTIEKIVAAYISALMSLYSVTSWPYPHPHDKDAVTGWKYQTGNIRRKMPWKLALPSHAVKYHTGILVCTVLWWLLLAQSARSARLPPVKMKSACGWLWWLCSSGLTAHGERHTAKPVVLQCAVRARKQCNFQ